MLESFDSLQSMGAQEVADIGMSPRFRLKNLATSPHVTQLLLDATAPAHAGGRLRGGSGMEARPWRNADPVDSPVMLLSYWVLVRKPSGKGLYTEHMHREKVKNM